MIKINYQALNMKVLRTLNNDRNILRNAFFIFEKDSIKSSLTNTSKITIHAYYVAMAEFEKDAIIKI